MIKESTQRVEDGASLSEQTGAALEKIIQGVEGTANKIAEIADAMSLPENTVKSHLFRARTQLRESIGSKLDIKEGH
ncbi:MAG: hypothetical protein IID42_05355 [Planctomycetes bacterium]|nr:hypothetical protein [Planctomycetota bacterium]